MDFSEALKHLKRGSAVARQNWNGKGMFIFLMPNQDFALPAGSVLAQIMPVGAPLTEERHIAMKTVDGSIIPWLASQSDLLNNDWEVTLDSEDDHVRPRRTAEY